MLTTYSTFKELHLFLKLPIEVRLKIWRDAARRSRIVAMAFAYSPYGLPVNSRSDRRRTESGRKQMDHDEDCRYLRVCPQTRATPMLWTNAEARNEGLKIYELRSFNIGR